VEDFFETITRGNVAEVKIILASVIAALAVYQLCLITVGYGKVRLPFLAALPAAKAHRAIGDAIVILTAIVALMCLSVYGFDEDGGVHAVAGVVVLGVIGVKVALVRWGGDRLGRLLPVVGLTLFALLTIAWATSAGDFLADR
jgi:Family of unknown function (DUF6529)